MNSVLEAAVSDAEVKHPILGSEKDIAGVVIPLGFLHFEKNPLARRIGKIGICLRHGEFSEDNTLGPLA